MINRPSIKQTMFLCGDFWLEDLIVISVSIGGEGPFVRDEISGSENAGWVVGV
jgi:hypothetical protein